MGAMVHPPGGGERHAAGPTEIVIKATGVVHTFSNGSDEPVRFLNFNTPAGFEHYMRDLAEEARSGPLTPDAIGRVASHYDFHCAT